MWKVGDRIKRNSPIHGEMIGTIHAVTAGVNQAIYHVIWETSKTGTIQSKELGGRDDRNWEPLTSQEVIEGEVKGKMLPSTPIARRDRTGSQAILPAHQTSLPDRPRPI